MIPFLKVKGIRQRWLLNSISILVMILVVVVAAFSLIIKNYYDSSILTDMESKARMAASYFSTEASSYNYNSSGDYLTAAQDYVSSFEDGTRIELQFLNPGGKVIYSSNGLTLSGTMPGTGDITQVQSYQEVATWKGVSSQTGDPVGEYPHFGLYFQHLLCPLHCGPGEKHHRHRPADCRGELWHPSGEKV